MGLSVEQRAGLAATMKILQTWATYQLFIQKGSVCPGVGPDFRERELKDLCAKRICVEHSLLSLPNVRKPLFSFDNFAILVQFSKPRMVARACKASTLGSRNRKIMSFKPSQAISKVSAQLRDSIFKFKYG